MIFNWTNTMSNMLIVLIACVLGTIMTYFLQWEGITDGLTLTVAFFGFVIIYLQLVILGLCRK